MEPDPSKEPEKNPLEGAKLPTDFTPEDITGAKTAPDVSVSAGDIPTGVLIEVERLLGDVSLDACTGSTDDYAYGIMLELSKDSEIHGLPYEASAAVEFLHTAVGSSAIDNKSGVIMKLSENLRAKEGPLYEEALDNFSGGGIDEEKYIRILENLAITVELISIWQLMQDQKMKIPPHLFEGLYSGLADMQCSDLVEIIDRHFITKSR